MREYNPLEMNRRRFLGMAGVTALAGLGLLTGCSTGIGATETGDENSSNGPKAANGKLDPDNPTKITFYSYSLGSGSNAPVMQDIIDTFNKTVGADKGVVVTGVADEQMGNLDKTKADIQAGNQVNIIQHTFPTLDASRLNLGIQAYEDVFDADEMKKAFDGMDERAQKLGVIDGKNYGIGFTFSTPILYINETMFEQAGLDPKSTNLKTWDDVASACKTIKDKTGQYGIAFPPSSTNSWVVESLVYSNGGSMFSKDRKKATFASKETTEAFEMWKGLFDAGYCAPGTDTESMQMFAVGKAAMTLTSTAALAMFKQAATAAGWQLGGVAEPGFGTKKPAPTNSGSCLAVRAQTEEEAAACWEFIKYATSAEAYTKITEGIGYLPLRPELIDDPKYLKDFADKNPVIRTNVEQLKNLHPATIWPGSNATETSKAFLDAVAKAVSTDADISSTMKDAQDQINGMLG